MHTTVRSPRRFDRRLYLGASLIFLALVLWTFARTFYLQPSFGTPPLSAQLHIHGAVMTGWVVLLVAQTSLIAAHRVQWHRRLGVFGAVWAALVVLLGSITTLHAAAPRCAVIGISPRVRASSQVWICFRCYFSPVSSL